MKNPDQEPNSRYREFKLTSSRGDADLHCVEWPVAKPVATLQLSHGMVEHVTRYSDFAVHLNGLGIAVVGHDHLGHGDTSPDDLGFIAEENGDELLVEDLHLVTQKVEELYPGVPHFILGHSMGSYVVRRYLTRYGDRVDGAVIVGTGNQSGAVVTFGRAMAGVICMAKGKHAHSPFLDKTVLGGYDKKFSEPDMPNRWTSRDPEQVARYNADPYCSFTFTAGAYRDLLTLISKVVHGDDINNIPKGLPVILLSGAEDPVGESGKGVRKAKEGLEKAGLSPEMKLYEGARHEIINETNREEVYRDIGDWLISHSRA